MLKPSITYGPTLLVGLAGFSRPGKEAGNAIRELTNKSGMNGNILLGTLAKQASEPGIGNLVQSYWYAVLLLPILFFTVRWTRQKRRTRTYRW